MKRILKRAFKKIYPDPIEKELERLVRLPRYVKGETSILGKKIYLVDGPSFTHGYDEIFRSGIYTFNPSVSEPLIIDCGANIGLATIFFKLNYPNARVLAFEPDPEIFKVLSKNVQSFGFTDVTLSEKAIWVNDHGVSFAPEGGFSGRIPLESDKGKKIKVPSVDLYEVLQGYEAIDFLKIDIEGAEYEVMKKIAGQLPKVKNFFLEYHSQEGKPQTLHEMLQMLHESGFRCHIQEAFVRKNPFVDTNDLMGMDLQLNVYAYR